MNDSKNSMIFYYDWQNLFEELDDSEIGQLVMAALRYDQSGEDTDFEDKGMRVAFKAMKNSIKVSNEKYQKSCEKKRQAMERRWKNNIKDNSDLYTSIDNYRKPSDTDTVTVTVTDTDTDTVTDTVTVTDTDTETDTETDINITPLTPLRKGGNGSGLRTEDAMAQISSRMFPVRVEQAVQDWFRYKMEKNQRYKPTGFKSLLTQIDNQLKQHGEQYVIDNITNSMSNNWQGIFWKDLQPKEKKQMSDIEYFLSQIGG